MRTKKGFVLRELCGENLLVASGKENIDFSSIISLNESAAFLWGHVQDKEFDANTLATLLTGEYDIDYDTALKDAQSLIEKWIQAGIVETD